MKKFLSAVICFMLVFSLCACSNGETQSDDGKLKIVTTFFPPYDFARQICSDCAEVIMLLPPGSEAHNYEPTVADMAKINSADIVIAAGGNLDSWIEKSVSVADSKVELIKMTDSVELVKTEHSECTDEQCHEHGHEHGDGYDEHVWTSPKNVMKIVEDLCEKISKADPENAGNYRKNTDEYLKKLGKLDSDFREAVKNGKRQEIVFAERFPFRYFAEEYGLEYYAAFSGCSSQNEPSLQTISFLVNKVKEDHIPVVFYIEFSSETVADTICRETGVKKLLFHSCHNVSVDDFKAGVTYLDLMEQNLKNLKEALA